MAWVTTDTEMQGHGLQEIENAVSQQTSEMWMRSKLIFFTIFATTAASFLTIHNEVIFISGSLLMLFLFYYLRSAAKSLPYKAVGGFLYQLADMAVALFQIFVATSLGSSASSFLTADGSFNIRSVNKVFILIMAVFDAMLILPKYFRSARPQK